MTPWIRSLSDVYRVAPPLLESSEAFLKWFRTFIGTETFNEINCRELDALRAAIALAKGESGFDTAQRVLENVRKR